MSVAPLSSSSHISEKAYTSPPRTGTPASDHPVCIHHVGETTVVVYSSPNQQPTRLNHPIVPSLHIVLVEEGKELEGLTEVLARFLTPEGTNL